MAVNRWQAPETNNVGPLDVMEWFNGPPVPDPVTFIIGEDWLDKSQIYPRQVTLIKIIFLRDDMFTDYDRAVIDEWQRRFRETNPDANEGKFSAQTKGLQPDLYERIAYLKRRGYRWFPELILAIGRRGSKGYLSALCMAYVLWNYLSLGDPQSHYGIDVNKPLACAVFAGKKQQAIENLWGDLYGVLTSAPCFTPYISEALAESLTIYAPYDFVRMRKMAQRGISSSKDMATFRIVPRESTPLAPRGPAGFILAFDEAAHVKNTGVTREFGVVYGAAKPSLDQFGTDGFTVLPSSTWEMIGKFYELWELSLQREPSPEPGETMPAYPTKFMVQLESWSIYEDWERAQLLPLFPEGFTGDLGEYHPDDLPLLKPLKGAIQAYDEEMAREEKANPDTFGVERRCIDLSTKVLTTDLTWKPAGEVEVGDELVGFDEFAPESEEPSKRPQRKLRTTTVTKVWRTREPAYRITFADGKSVICSAYHRWFSDNRWRSLYPPPGTPGPRQVMKVGDTIRWIVDPWEDDDSREAGYLAGMYDGEGSFLGRGRDRQEFSMTVVQNPGLVLNETLRILKDKGFRPVKYRNGKKAEQWYVTGLADCLRFVGQIKPVRFYPKRRQLWEGRAPHGIGDICRTKTIVSIDKLPERELVDIETTTHTFIAEGLISHNSNWATAMDAYLNTAKIEEMFAPWADRDPAYGRPELTMQGRGPLSIDYTAHGDPASVNCRFGFSLAHAEPGPEGMNHVVFDLVHYWEPADFDGHIIDYDEVRTWIFDNVVLRFQPDELTFDQWNCLNGSVLIPTPNGLLTMRELAGDLPVGQTKTLNALVQSQDRIETATAIHHKGTVPVLRLRTKHGIDLKCTPEHRVLIRRAKAKVWHPVNEWEWVTAAEIKTGDEVRLRLGSALAAEELDISGLIPVSQKSAVKHSEGVVGALYERHLAGEAKAPLERESGMGAGTLTRRFRTLGSMNPVAPPFAKTLDEHLGWLLGFLVAEATIGDRHWAVTQKDKTTIRYALDCASKSFGLARRHFYDENYQGKYQVGWFYGHDLETRFLKSLGMDQVPAQQKSVPWSVRRSPERVVAAFMRGLFEGDGSVVARSANDEEVSLTTTSEQLGIEVQQLLHAMGILATRWTGTYQYKGETRAQWRVKIFGQDILRYQEKIGFVSPAKSRALNLACGQIRARGSAVGLRDRFRRGEDWYYDKIVGIQDGGEEDCYDISVPGPECFVADGIIVHNSMASVQAMQKLVRGAHLQKNVMVYERTATAALNWATYETFKAALNMGFVHCPPHGELKDELRFLQKPEGQQKVVPPDSGPVRTKDISDCAAIVVSRMLGEQMKMYLASDLRNQRPHMSQQGGHDALDRFSPDMANPFSAELGAMAGRGGLARGMRSGTTPRAGRMPSGRSGGGGLAGMRRHRS